MSESSKTYGNILVDGWVSDPTTSELCSDPKSHDNRGELFKNFRLSFGPEFLCEYQWFCKKCGKPCFSEEVWFSCKNAFCTTRVICRSNGCCRWHLEVNCLPSEEEEESENGKERKELSSRTLH